MIKRSLQVVLLISGLLNIYYCSAQFFPVKNYPKNYFAYPVEAPVSLSANFGELRSNHYHMGLDCRTAQVQNKRILASAEGYIARVKIEPWGYGRAIYINHPNGLTTLYAHLNDFFPALEAYVKEQQYKLKSWAVFLDIPPDSFPVTKEMFIAFSGNTGGSQGPHLHFEIRDTKTDKVLNPTLFGFPVPDTIAPDIYRLAVYDRHISTYEQTPRIYTLKKVNGIYTTTPSLVLVHSDKISFGITATDRSNGSANRNGIYETVLYQDEKPIIGFQLDNISYDETRYLNAHIDYTQRSNGGRYIQHISKLPGFNNSLYKSTPGNGVIDLDTGIIYKIKLEVKDADGNTSIAAFDLKQQENATPAKTTDTASFYQQLSFHPGFVNPFENNRISFYLAENCLYDSIRFRYQEINAGSEFPLFRLHHTGVPVHCYFPVSIKARTDYPDKMVMRRFAGNKNDYKKASPVNNRKDTGWYRAEFREFGSFQLMIDTIPPAIRPIGFKDGISTAKLKQLVFGVKDNTEEIKSFTATINGKWLRFSNDKGSRFIYTFDEMCPPGEHELKIIVEDQVGNITEKNYRLIR